MQTLDSFEFSFCSPKFLILIKNTGYTIILIPLCFDKDQIANLRLSSITFLSSSWRHAQADKAFCG